MPDITRPDILNRIMQQPMDVASLGTAPHGMEDDPTAPMPFPPFTPSMVPQPTGPSLTDGSGGGFASKHKLLLAMLGGLGGAGAMALGGKNFRQGMAQGMQNIGPSVVRALMGRKHEQMGKEAQQARFADKQEGRDTMLARLGLYKGKDVTLKAVSDEAIRQEQKSGSPWIPTPDGKGWYRTNAKGEREYSTDKAPGTSPKTEPKEPARQKALAPDGILRWVDDGTEVYPGIAKKLKPIPAADNEKMALMGQAINGLDDLEKQMKHPDVSGAIGPVFGRIGVTSAKAAYSPKLSDFLQNSNLTGQLIARMFERGVISDADREFYVSLLPNKNSDKDVALSNLRQLRTSLKRIQEDRIQGFQGQGFSTEGLGGETDRVVEKAWSAIQHLSADQQVQQIDGAPSLSAQQKETLKARIKK